jgi:DNA polymerase I
MYLTPNGKVWAIDVEGDLIPSTRIWVVCAINFVTREKIKLTDYKEIKEWFKQRLEEGCKFVGHNIIGYDAPTLNRIVGTKLTMSCLIDTMVMSMLYNPSLEGGHSLEAWGRRLRVPKGDFNDFSKLSDEMVTYCFQDTLICLLAYRELVARMRKAHFSVQGIELEHKAWQLIKKQQVNGFAFNIEEAHILYALLRKKENLVRDKLYEYWPQKLTIVETYKRPIKKDGSESSNLVRHREQYERVVVRENDGEYDCYAYVSFNIGSPDQRIEKLLELGWKPIEKTKTGKPKPTDKGKLVPSLVQFVETSGKEEPKLIAHWIELNSRANMINTWIEAYNEKTKCIHGSLWLANTLRYRHSNPNTANIPAVRLGKEDRVLKEDEGSFTYEARDLWTVRDLTRRSLVGVDAKGIQLRVLAHYLNNPEFTKAVLDGDPHSYNQEIGGFGTRAIAKTFIYAFLLGCGDAKAGQIIGGSVSDGKEVKARFIGNFPGLKDLLESLERQIQRTGRIRLCDGTPIIVSAMHTRLGYLLQGDENRIMKKAALITNREVIRRELDVIKVGDIHDEWQNDVLNAHVNEFKDEVCPFAFAEAGKSFNYRLPIDCDAKVGLTWVQTH